MVQEPAVHTICRVRRADKFQAMIHLGWCTTEGVQLCCAYMFKARDCPLSHFFALRGDLGTCYENGTVAPLSHPSTGATLLSLSIFTFATIAMRLGALGARATLGTELSHSKCSNRYAFGVND